jgi:hypothetical protein
MRVPQNDKESLSGDPNRRKSTMAVPLPRNDGGPSPTTAPADRTRRISTMNFPRIQLACAVLLCFVILAPGGGSSSPIIEAAENDVRTAASSTAEQQQQQQQQQQREYEPGVFYQDLRGYLCLGAFLHVWEGELLGG